jgi:hypothetical protein
MKMQVMFPRHLAAAVPIGAIQSGRASSVTFEAESGEPGTIKSTAKADGLMTGTTSIRAAMKPAIAERYAH